MNNQKQIEADAILEQAEADAARPRSVVAPTYKVKYAERALSARGKKGVAKKVVARSCGDWLALELAALCVDPQTKHLDVAKFEGILDANSVKHDHWNRTTPGWQGRLRMTGRLALQRVVAETGVLLLPDGTELQAPKAWVARHQR